MITKFKVHGANRVPFSRPVQVDGQTLMASVPCLEVELVTEDVASGSLTLRFFGDKIEEAAAIYVVDADLDASWSAAV